MTDVFFSFKMIEMFGKNSLKLPFVEFQWNAQMNQPTTTTKIVQITHKEKQGDNKWWWKECFTLAIWRRIVKKFDRNEFLVNALYSNWYSLLIKTKTKKTHKTREKSFHFFCCWKFLNFYFCNQVRIVLNPLFSRSKSNALYLFFFLYH